MRPRLLALITLLLIVRSNCLAGLHYSGEQWAELPAQWSGYLLDHRALRMLAVPPSVNQPASALRERYIAERDRLQSLDRALTADEAADLGALHVRLGAAEQAVGVLRSAQRQHPDHFRIAANLGTAYQLTGEMNQAIAALELAVQLAPPRWKPAEELHLKFVRQRRGEAKQTATLDSLFGVTFSGEPSPPAGLSGDAVSLAQTLGLWLPADGRILWQLGELTMATGDPGKAAAMLEGCVSEFGMSDPDLRRRRVQFRTTADQRDKGVPLGKGDSQTAHAGHQGESIVRFKSKRPLVRQATQFQLPPIRIDGVNPLPWHVLAETSLNKPFQVSFHSHLQKLDGKRVSLTGFIQPTGDHLDQLAVLLIEYPVGCWFCEIPEPTGIILVEPPAGQTISLTRDLVRVEGRLKLNAKDPEEFIYTISDAKVAPPD